MQTHIYKMKGSDIEPSLHGRELRQAKPESVADFKTLIVNGDEGRIVALAVQQFLLNCQREAKAAAQSEEVLKLVREAQADPANVDSAKMDAAWAIVQKAADDYRDGGTRAPGKSAEVKAKAAKADRIQQAAANDPALAKKLAALGIEF